PNQESKLRLYDGCRHGLPWSSVRHLVVFWPGTFTSSFAALDHRNATYVRQTGNLADSVLSWGVDVVTPGNSIDCRSDGGCLRDGAFLRRAYCTFAAVAACCCSAGDWLHTTDFSFVLLRGAVPKSVLRQGFNGYFS